MAVPTVSPSKSGLQPSPAFIDSCWTVPFITGFISLLISIPQTNSGMLFVLFMDTFDVNRQTAAWPKTIYTATTSLMGASYGALVIGAAVYVVSYFHEYRGFATGIKFLGVSLSGIVGPSLLSHLASEHGLKGCFLITGGLTLHLIPLAFMLRYAKPVRWACCRSREASDYAVKGVTTILYGTTTTHVQEPNGSNYTIKHPVFECDSVLGTSDGLVGRNSLSTGAKNAIDIVEKHSIGSATPHEQQSAPLGFLAQAMKVLRSPCFYVLLVAMVAADFTLPLFGSTIVDYAVDKGIAFNAAAQLVVCQCLGGFVGRLVIPLITDKIAHSRCPITAISLALLSLSFCVFPHVTSFAAVATVSFVIGAQQGYLNAFKSVLVADYLGVHSVAVSWGIMGVALLPLVCCEPYIVGAFRDTRGSYDNLYRMCGAVDLFATLMVAAQACFDSRMRKKSVETFSTK
ncbi:uncharacterized protein LOC119390544 isoform X2 [Rhipicephalus sanguineus]|uniref:uncharacterized protein LOC119390544 isoform X2 n=1 Tax=Rhipicephalus sanguineus TaxID=34632 RepID=UPI00189446B4|nr:uncharacterized protein LOC119390544 isoform X2 [Rhipicephalus sanguineus]